MSDKGIELADLLGVISLYIGIRNLAENEEQSEQSLKLIKQNNVFAANDKQAAYLLKKLDEKFDEQNIMLNEILQALKGEK